MHLPAGAFCNVSGVDPNDGAKIVFVWHRDKGPEDYVLLGSGHVVGAIGRPPGIQTGQFSVTFPLPPACSADDIVVTDNMSGKEALPGVTVTPCSPVSGLKAGGTNISGERAVGIGATNASPQPSQIVLARKRS
jgi:hypothetical protein